MSKTEPLDSERVVLDLNGQYHVFLGSNGPCKVAVNIGGKIFRAHYDEVNRGIIDEELKSQQRRTASPMRSGV